MTHDIVNPSSLAKPAGFAHAVVAAPGRTVYLGGQTAQGPSGEIVGATIVEQFTVAAGNVVTALAAAGYRAALPDLAPVYRQHFGRHYPAIALLGVAELFDPDALLELVGTAVVPA